MLTLKNFFKSYPKLVILGLACLFVTAALETNIFSGNLKSKILISGTHYRKDKHNLSEVYGQIANNDFRDHDVMLKVFFYSKDGGRVSVEEGTARDVEARATEPFRIFTTDDVSGFARFEVKILSVD